jgi:hypothetical protein
MLKINLSGGEETGDSLSNSEETLHSAPQPQEKSKSSNRKKKKIAPLPVILVLLLILAIVAVIYFQRGMIQGLFKGKSKPAEVVPAQKIQPKPRIKLQPEPTAPLDPVFSTLSEITQIIPPKVWITSLTINHDWSFEVQGISFSYPAIDSLISSLSKSGKKTVVKHLPKRAKSAETVYRFSLSVKNDSLSVPDVWDIIPQDKLIAIADTMKNRSREFGVKFIRYPVKEKIYKENDLPFEIEGTYEGLMKIIPLICFEDKNVRIYRMVIKPSSHDKGFNRIRASFAVRMISLL